jgi:hypothetical protein
MKKFIPAFLLLMPALLIGAANDIKITQRKPDDSGFIERTISPQASSVLTFDGSKLMTTTLLSSLGGGTGTVTSVDITAPAAGITVSGGPITTAGSLTLALANDLAALEALSGTSTIYYRSGTSAWTAVTIGSGLDFTAGTLSATGGGSGTVTEFSAGNLSPLFTTSVATETTTPALTFALSNAAQNAVFAGPGSGGAGAPTFRALVALDIPDISATYLTTATAATTYTPLTRTISTTAPLAGGGDLSANRTLSIADAAADGTTKGAASFTAADFDATAGVVSIDYTNGQAASGSTKGFLASADWTTFNGKQAAGNYITALTGDVTASGPGSSAATVTAINGTSLGGLATGILKNTTTTGVPSIAAAGDFPTLNQNTTGSAATLTTPRAIYGNNFDGSAALTQVIASTYGGTGNGFTKFSGPATSEKTFTLPNASATILTDNAAVTVAQGGTGAATLTGLLQGNGTSAITGITNSSTVGQVLRTTGAATYAWGALDLADSDAVTGILPVANGGIGVSLTPSNDDVLQRKSGAWTNRTLAQYWTDLMANPTVGGYAYTALPWTITDDKRLLGRDAAISFQAQEISIGTSLDLSSSTLNAIQDIRTSASPTFAGLTLSSPLTAANGGTGISSLGTGVATALGTNVGSAGAFVVNGGALGTPSSGTVTNLTGTASININGTVGATTPSTVAATTLTNSGTASLGVVPGGTGIVSTGDNNTGNGVFRLFGGSTQKGWQIGSNITEADALEFSQATSGGGTTFGSTILKITSTGINATAIGATTPSTGAFTGLSSSGPIYAGGNSISPLSNSLFYAKGDMVNAFNGSYFENTGGAGTSYAAIFNSGGSVGSISFTTTATSFNTSSDRRLKTNIRDFTGSAAIIDAIKPRIYDWKTGEKDTVGFVAQELHKVYPAAVTKGDDGEEITQQWAVDYSKLVPVLVAEIQALRARVAALEAKQSPYGTLGSSPVSQ